MMRLDKMLSHCGYGSRKEVKEIIRKGYVLVNGEVITNDDYKIDEIKDEIIVADEEIIYEKEIYFMMNKPMDYVTATLDCYERTVMDLIYGYEKRNLFPVGRLDKDTKGLLLITNNGKLAHQLLSPKNHVDKVYDLIYKGTITPQAIKSFEKGVVLDDGYICMPAKLIPLELNRAQVIIKEGKYHQVKRMMEAIGCSVIDLKRIQFGPLKLDEMLKPGEYRSLTSEEIEALKNKKIDG